MILKVKIIQIQIAGHNPPENHSKISTLIKRQPPKPGGLLVLPELFSTGAINNISEFEHSGGEAVFDNDKKFLSGLARKTGCHVLGSSITKKNNKLENLSLTFSPGGRLRCAYNKIHPFSIGGEDENFRAGKNVTRQRIGGILIQNTICYDLRFPEMFAAGFRQGVGLFTVQSNWPASRQHHWDCLLQARAIETQSYVLGVNITGRVNKVSYQGGSKLVSPKGRIIFNTGKREGIFSTEINKNLSTLWKKKFPVLQDKKSWSFYSRN